MVGTQAHRVCTVESRWRGRGAPTLPQPRNWRTQAGGHAQAGSATIFLLAIIPVLVILLGLVYDGGEAYTAHTRALNLAEQAARTGAQEVDLATVRAGGPYRLNQSRAVSAASAYLAAGGPQGGQVSIVPDPQTGADAVQVTVPWSVATTFLGIIGKSEISGTATASARNAAGVINEDF
jgi:Flp pilus assembly protein TadG